MNDEQRNELVKKVWNREFECVGELETALLELWQDGYAKGCSDGRKKVIDGMNKYIKNNNPVIVF